MARLLLEIWKAPQGLEMCVIAGPMGDAARAVEGDGAQLIHRFVAGSHVEAMNYYHTFLGREPYTTEYPVEDSQPYPDEWRAIQIADGITPESAD